MEELFGRANAIRQIEPFIEVITGIRRSGKSSILLLLAKHLKQIRRAEYRPKTP